MAFERLLIVPKEDVLILKPFINLCVVSAGCVQLLHLRRAIYTSIDIDLELISPDGVPVPTDLDLRGVWASPLALIHLVVLSSTILADRVKQIHDWPAFVGCVHTVNCADLLLALIEGPILIDAPAVLLVSQSRVARIFLRFSYVAEAREGRHNHETVICTEELF